MKPFDPRLLRLAGLPVAAVAGLGAAATGLIIAQAIVLSRALAAAFTGTPPATGTLALLAGLFAARAAVAWATETTAHRASATVKGALRQRLAAHALRLGPAWLSRQRTTEITQLATTGVNALDDYFGKYLPQLVLAVIVPIAVLAVIVPADLISGLTIIVTLPLIPVFMALIGLATAAHTRKRRLALARLGHHFLDVVAGLPTLKIFGRAKAQAQQIQTITSLYRRATLRTLRLAFLSSLVLELLATISVALVAVGIGLRLVHGNLTLATALLILLLAPEAYLPLRAVGAHFHASADGAEAATRVFEILETPPPPAGTRPVPASPAITVHGLTVHHPGRDTPAPRDLSLTAAPGEFVAITGPSGTGKTTLLNAILGFTPTEAITISSTPLPELDPAAWHRHIAWLPQEPRLATGTTIPTGHAFLDDIPPGQLIGEDGAGLSSGQRRRLALARALDRRAPVLLLDEPTAGCDPHREQQIITSLRAAARDGALVLAVSHRPALTAAADKVVTL
ncbi:thiol reductant ABC exporter subunit CydD [Longispora albida]|uniref:thiol reductant ABC exporter subunit CydD n=1 Tax=Longispora albida TaxID=203523 RepID=UPI000361119F|nr:thiol reductant ABC exporter subunit CydD [Longispora albida]